MNQENQKQSDKPLFSGCGMCGVVALNGNIAGLSSLDMPAMVKSMHHRGPNGHGIFETSTVSLGHTRLSILDLSEHGKQPMTKDSITITYNGEVYNYPDIRSSLLQVKPELEFESSTDTEVLLRTLQIAIENHQGNGFPDIKTILNRLNGFFGFGLWDEARQRLLLVRDRYGIKPVYYMHRSGEFFAFASEVETLLASKLFKPIADLETIQLFCSISSFFSQTPRTLVKDLYSLRQGHYMWIEAKTGAIHEETYYELPNNDPALANVTREEAVAHMKHLLEDSIQLRMLSDVPLSTFLSGGIDSSVITAIASHSSSVNSKDAESSNIHSSEHPETQKGTKAVTAFTVTYIGQGQNPAAASDEEYAKKVSSHLGSALVNHQQVPVDPMTFTLDDLDEISDMGTFSDDDRLLTVLLNYRAVAQNGFSVILNGQGADEAMGGYIGSGWFKIGAVDVQQSDTILFDKVLDLVIDTKLFQEPMKRFIPKARELFKQSWSQYSGEPFEIAMKWLFDTSLHRILRFEDYLSMRSAVECRVPFLDYRLVDYCFRLPWQLHVNPQDYTGKLILRDVSRSYLPQDVCDRPKQTFPNVEQNALNERLRKLITANLDQIRECPVIKHVFIPQIFETPQSLDQCSGSDFWVILIYWRWWVKFASYAGTFPVCME